MRLAVDIGNTRIKYAVYENDTVLDYGVFDRTRLEEAVWELLEKNPGVTEIAVASVGSLGHQAFEVFQNKVPLRFVAHGQRFPFENAYATPHTLGIDRMVLASGAVLAYPGVNRLVIDAGTCVTYDFVDDKDVYHGGAISPGIRLRYEALHHYTAKLPLLEKAEPEDLVGSSTAQSIHSGVINGLACEIDGFIDAYRARHSNFIIILTGGDGDFLAKRLKNTIFAHSNFLLESLNQTIQYQIKNV